MNKIENILVCGATSEIVRQTLAHLSLNQASHIYICGRDKDRLEEIRKELAARDQVNVTCVVVDLVDAKGRQSLLSQVHEVHFDRMIVGYGSLTENDRCLADPEYLVRELEINYVSVVALLAIFADRINDGGQFVVLGSVAGDRGRYSNFFYGSAKAGIGEFVSGFRALMLGRNVNVLLVKPGLIKTPMTTEFHSSPLAWSSKVAGRNIAKAMLSRRDTVYTPWFWQWIMLIIRMLPTFVFKRLKF